MSKDPGILPIEFVRQFAEPAAIEWCGEKERETFPGDIAYFLNNWQHLPGLRVRVEALAYRAYHLNEALTDLERLSGGER